MTCQTIIKEYSSHDPSSVTTCCGPKRPTPSLVCQATLPGCTRSKGFFHKGQRVDSRPGSHWASQNQPVLSLPVYQIRLVVQVKLAPSACQFQKKPGLYRSDRRRSENGSPQGSSRESSGTGRPRTGQRRCCFETERRRISVSEAELICKRRATGSLSRKCRSKCCWQ